MSTSRVQHSLSARANTISAELFAHRPVPRVYVLREDGAAIFWPPDAADVPRAARDAFEDWISERPSGHELRSVVVLEAGLPIVVHLLPYAAALCGYTVLIEGM